MRRIPHRYKFRGGQTKYLLKKALEPVLAASLLHRSKKGFGVPIGGWLKEGVLKFDQDGRGPLDPAFVRRRLTLHQRNRSDERAFLWNSWLLQVFSRTHAGAVGAPAS